MVSPFAFFSWHSGDMQYEYFKARSGCSAAPQVMHVCNAGPRFSSEDTFNIGEVFDISGGPRWLRSAWRVMRRARPAARDARVQAGGDLRPRPAQPWSGERSPRRRRPGRSSRVVGSESRPALPTEGGTAMAATKYGAERLAPGFLRRGLLSGVAMRSAGQGLSARTLTPRAA